MSNLEAKLISSSVSLESCPKPDKPEFAFIGRSNVGKSSLINLLVNNKNLAPTSDKPGKTKQIHHYLVQNSWFLVDLPGYGYAKVSKDRRQQWGDMIQNYILQRPTLKQLFILVDASIPPQNIDLEFIGWTHFSQIPFSVIFTKTDKAKQAEIHKNITETKEILQQNFIEPNFFQTSATKKTGRGEILNFINQIK